MSRSRISAVVALALAGTLAGSTAASATPRLYPTLAHEIAAKQAAIDAGVTFPQPPCPENGVVNGIVGASGVPGVGVGQCGVVQPAATTLPWPGPMAYAGGHVQVHPHEYIVFWGWGAKGAFPGRTCTPVTLTETTRDGSQTFTLPCDPDGAGKQMADFVAQIGGTQWMGSQTQYYETAPDSTKHYIQNDPNVLAGVWVDNGDPTAGDNPDLNGTNQNNPAGDTNTYTRMAAEATRAAGHFGVADADLINANFIIVQPAGFSDPVAQKLGYCAFHDYTESDATGNGYYKDPSVKQGNVAKGTPGIAYTNMPYVLNQGTGCGQDLVNPEADGGKLDGFTVALGHEIEETVTDPGGEATVGNVTNAGPSNATTGGATFLGAWYDATDPNENGDKCAYVGQITNGVTGSPIPGSSGNIGGNQGERFAVQSLWSNAAAGGAGYCAGVSSTDLPSPLDGEQTGSQGGTRYPYTDQFAETHVPPTCNTDHLFSDSNPDAPSTLSPDPTTGSTSGTQQDSLDLTQGDLSFSAGTLTATFTLADLRATSNSPGKVNRYIVSWTQGSTQYGAEVLIDGLGNVQASDGTPAANKAQSSYAQNPLPSSAATVTPGKNGTIVLRIPTADVGNPKAGTELDSVAMETVEAAGALQKNLGYAVDTDNAVQPYVIGAPVCAPATAAGTHSSASTHAGSAHAKTHAGARAKATHKGRRTVRSRRAIRARRG